MTIYALLYSQKSNNKIALIEKNEKISYKELYSHIQMKRNILMSIHNANSNVALLLPNSIEYIEWYYSIILNRSTVVPIFYHSSNYEIISMLNSCDISVIISDTQRINDLISKKDIITNKLSLINIENNKISYINIDKMFVKYNNQGTSIMLSTSGSLQRPKRVMLNEKNLLSNVVSIITSLQYQSTERFLILLPLCFASANTSQLLVSLVLGATVVIYNDILHPRKIANAINSFDITSLTIVPSIFNKLVEADSFQTNQLESLRTICFGGGPTSFNNICKAAEKFKNINLVQMYGQTEASSRISHMFVNLHKNTSKIKSVGKPIPDIQVKIVNKSHEELSCGKTGEIAVKGDNVMSGYYRQPQETNRVLKDKWLLTGDIGYIDGDGFLYITGRKKNMLIYSGINVYPEEIEDVISGNENVDDVIVYGKPDSEYGEVPIANIIFKEGRYLKDKELIEYCKRFLPLHKIPVQFNCVKEIIYTKNGKKLRKTNEVHK